jgi:hypothetical protein
MRVIKVQYFLMEFIFMKSAFEINIEIKITQRV